MKQENEYLLLFIFLVIVLFAFAYRNLLGSGTFAYGDLVPFPTTSADAFKLFFNAWSPKSMGSVESEPFSTFILGFLLTISGNNAVFVQKLVFLSLLPTSAITMYILLGHFIKSQPARFIASFLYSVNRMTIGEFISMSISTLSIYALLPLILLFSLRIFEEEKTSNKIRNTMMIIIFSSLAFGNSIQVVYAILLPVVAVFFLIYLCLSRAKLRYVFIVIPLFLVAFLSSHLLLQMFSPWYFGLWFPKEGILHTLPMEFQIYNLANCYTYPPTTIANSLRLAWAEVHSCGSLCRGVPRLCITGLSSSTSCFFFPTVSKALEILYWFCNHRSFNHSLPLADLSRGYTQLIPHVFHPLHIPIPKQTFLYIVTCIRSNDSHHH